MESLFKIKKTFTFSHCCTKTATYNQQPFLSIRTVNGQETKPSAFAKLLNNAGSYEHTANVEPNGQALLKALVQ